MSATNADELSTHVGHDIECVTYGKDNTVANVAVECVTCNVVLVDFDV